MLLQTRSRLQNSKGAELPLGLAGCIVVAERPKITPSRVMLGNIDTGHPVNSIFPNAPQSVKLDL